VISSYALIYLLGYAVPAFVGFFALIVYTHLLSPAEYGLYVVGSGIAALATTLCFTWVRQSVSRYQASSPDIDLRPEATVAYGWTVGVIACLAPIVLFIAQFVAPSNIGSGVLAASLFLSVSLGAFEVSQEFKRARFHPFLFMTIATIRSLSGLGLGYAVIKLGGGGLGLLAAVAASFWIGNALSFATNSRALSRRASLEHIRQFMRYGLPFTFGALAFGLHSVLDRLGVAFMLGQSGAGYYGLAAEISRHLIGVLAASVSSALFPIAFRSLAESGAGATRERLKEGAELLLAVVAPVAAWLAISADVVTGTLLSPEFGTAVAALVPILAVAGICGAVNQYYIQVSFQLAEKPLLQVVHDVWILAANTALLFPLTRAFGLSGAAMAILIAEGFGIFVGIWLSRRAFKLPFNTSGMLRVLASVAIMALFTYAAKAGLSDHGLLALISVAATGGVAYACAALMCDLAGIRSTFSSFVWPRQVPAE